MTRHRLSLLLLAIVLAGCASGAGDRASAPRRVDADVPFRLALGETVAIAGGGTTVRFAELLEDSRCPRGVVCVQAGRARVRLDVGDGGRTLELSTEPPASRGASGGVELELRDVHPAPVAGRTTPPASIEAELVARLSPG